MHDPPSSARSINATFHPRSASAYESGLPACPDPITIASNFISFTRRTAPSVYPQSLPFGLPLAPDSGAARGVDSAAAQGNFIENLTPHSTASHLKFTDGQGMGKQGGGRTGPGISVQRRSPEQEAAHASSNRNATPDASASAGPRTRRKTIAVQSGSTLSRTTHPGLGRPRCPASQSLQRREVKGTGNSRHPLSHRSRQVNPLKLLKLCS